MKKSELNKDLIKDENTRSIEHDHAIQSEFLQGLGHEIRTPLNVVIGFMQLLKQSNPSNLRKDQLDCIEEVLQGANELVDINNEMLTWSKVGLHSHQVNLQSVDVLKSIYQVNRILSVSLAKKNITLLVRLNNNRIKFNQPVSDELLAVSDPQVIQQALIILLTFLLKQTKHNGVMKIDITKNAPLDRLIIAVESEDALYSDAERALLNNNVKKVNFNKKNNTNIRMFELNLNKIKSLITAISGKCKILEKQTGSYFFEISLESTESLNFAPIRGSNSDINTLLDKKSQPLEKPCVLYIEDNPASVRLVKQLLANCLPVKFLSSNNAASGLSIAMKNALHLILVDINLPDFDGFELLRSLRQVKHLSDCKIIAVSGYNIKNNLEYTKEIDFDDYISKPINIDVFEKIIRKYL